MGTLDKNNENGKKINSKNSDRILYDNVYHFIDDSSNVTQIKKEKRNRLKYYIDPKTIDDSCYIGINDPKEGDCSEGVGLGFGDYDIMALANYERKLIIKN